MLWGIERGDGFAHICPVGGGASITTFCVNKSVVEFDFGRVHN
jgi:hypothetical protein